ncbi:MAG: TetR/AcrR family transcriptional regulator [Spirochaetales bacterium]|nr:TetR/AcrR family transcriptional regulator [Spirochaetales bacterium]
MSKKEAPEIRKKQILEAAKKLFVKKGYHSTSIDDITHECGLTKGGIYWHFKSKWEIFTAMIEEHKQASRSLWGMIRTFQLERQQLVEGGLLFIREHCKDEWIMGVYSEIEAEAMRNPVIRDQYLAILDEEKKNLSILVEEAHSRGVLKTSDPKMLSEVIFLFMYSCINFYSLTKGTYNIEVVWREFCASILDGILKEKRQIDTREGF